MKSNLSFKYLEYFKIGFKKSIEYKSYLLGVFITPLFLGTFFYYIWSYIYEVKGAGDPNFLIGGFTFIEMLAYLFIILALNVFKNSNISESISGIVKSGDIAIYLCRPINFIKSLLFEEFGTKVINFFVFFILVFVMTFFLGLPYPTGSILGIFIIYGLLLIFFDIILYTIIGGLSFWLVEIWGVRASISQVLSILSGRILPLSLFPAWMQSFLAFTPFLYLEYTFASIYLGKLSIEEALRAMGIFVFWIILLLLLLKFVFNKGFRKLESFGG